MVLVLKVSWGVFLVHPKASFQVHPKSNRTPQNFFLNPPGGQTGHVTGMSIIDLKILRPEVHFATQK